MAQIVSMILLSSTVILNPLFKRLKNAYLSKYHSNELEAWRLIHSAIEPGLNTPAELSGPWCSGASNGRQLWQWLAGRGSELHDNEVLRLLWTFPSSSACQSRVAHWLTGFQCRLPASGVFFFLFFFFPSTPYSHYSRSFRFLVPFKRWNFLLVKSNCSRKE